MSWLARLRSTKKLVPRSTNLQGRQLPEGLEKLQTAEAPSRFDGLARTGGGLGGLGGLVESLWPSHQCEALHDSRDAGSRAPGVARGLRSRLRSPAFSLPIGVVGA